MKVYSVLDSSLVSETVQVKKCFVFLDCLMGYCQQGLLN